MLLGTLQALGDIDLTTVNTNYPVLAAGLYPFTIAECKVVPTKDNKGQLLEVGLKLEIGALDDEGAPIEAGYKTTSRIGLTTTDKRDGKMIAADVARLLDAAYGETERKLINLGEFDVERLIGVSIMCKSSVEPEKDGYPKQVRVRFVKREVKV